MHEYYTGVLSIGVLTAVRKKIFAIDVEILSVVKTSLRMRP